MEYSIAYDAKDDLIVITLQGEAELGSLSKMINTLAQTFKETSSNRVLIDVRHVEHKLSLIEMVTLSGMLQSVAKEHEIDLMSLRRAMVSQMNGRMMELYEIIARYLGGPFARFNNLEDAKAWLKQT